MKGIKATSQAQTANSSPLAGRIGRILQMREVSLAILLIIFGACLSLATPNFLRIDNFRVLLQGMSTDMLIAIPMCISLIAGNVDFSGGSALCLNGAICAMMLNKGVPIPL